MLLPWPLLLALAAPAFFGLVYGVGVKASGRLISTRLLAYEVGALALLVFGWLFLVAVGAAGSD